MGYLVQGDRRGDVRAALAEDSEASDWAAVAITATEPSGDGVFTLTHAGLYVPRAVELFPFGTDGDGEAFALRLWGWDRDPASSYWYPKKLCELTVTFGTATGTAGSLIPAASLRADTLAIVSGTANQDVWLFSPADDTVASARVLTRGSEKIQFDFKKDSAASMNCLWKPAS